MDGNRARLRAALLAWERPSHSLACRPRRAVWAPLPWRRSRLRAENWHRLLAIAGTEDYASARMSALVSPSIESLLPYEGGKPVEELSRELGIVDAIKLASNENPLGPGPKALAAGPRARRHRGGASLSGRGCVQATRARRGRAPRFDGRGDSSQRLERAPRFGGAH